MATFVDPPDGGTVDPTGGSTGGPAVATPRTATINWDFPTTLNQYIIGFDVVLYSGSDVSDLSTWVFKTTVDPTVRTYVKSFAPPSTMAVVNASVRAIYA